MNTDRRLYNKGKKCSVRDGLHDTFYDLNRRKLQEHLLVNGISPDPYHSDTVRYKLPLGYRRYEEVIDPNAKQPISYSCNKSQILKLGEKKRKLMARQAALNNEKYACMQSKNNKEWQKIHQKEMQLRNELERLNKEISYCAGNSGYADDYSGFHGSSSKHGTYYDPSSLTNQDIIDAKNRVTESNFAFLNTGKRVSAYNYPKSHYIYENAAPTPNGPFNDGGMSRGVNEYKVGPTGYYTNYNNRNKIRTYDSMHTFGSNSKNSIMVPESRIYESVGEDYPSLQNPYAYTRQQRIADLIRYSNDHDEISPSSCPYNNYAKYVKSGRFGNHHGALNDERECMWC